MSPTTRTGPDEPMDDTPPHGVPPVRRAALASRLGPPDDAPFDDAPFEDAPFEDERLGDAPNGDAPFEDERLGDAPNGDAPNGDAREDDTSQPGAVDADGPVRVTRRHAGRARARGRIYDAGTHRRSRVTRRGRLVAAVLAVLAVLAGALAWYEVESHPFGKPGKAVLVDVQPGESLGTITSALTRAQVIGTSFAFRLWSVVHGAPVVRPGTYQLHRNLSFAAAKTALDAGPNVVQVNVLAGTTMSELTNELASLPGHLARPFVHAGSASGVRSPFQLSPGTPLEGLIGTGSYRVFPGEQGRTLLRQMVGRFVAEARAAGLTPTTTVGGLNAYQLVTVASIAQKEGYYTRYMGDVSRVIFNRLAAGMHLDMTSTVLYSLGKDGGPVTPQEEQLTTPYNTYLHPGLTPTPICTPSVDALRAAVHPPAGSWLYFDLVTDQKGIMKFASTYTQQVALVQQAAANAAKHSTTAPAT